MMVLRGKNRCLWRGCTAKRAKDGDGRCSRHAEMVRRSSEQARLIAARMNEELESRSKAKRVAAKLLAQVRGEMEDAAQRDSREAAEAERHELALRLAVGKLWT